MKIHHLLPFSVVALAALLSVPASASAQSILLTSGNFAVLGKTTVTNGGATNIISGNVGLSPGTSITGFPPGTFTGGGMKIIGGTSDQAVADLLTAANGLAGMPTTTGDNLSNQDLGGKTLLPGVYTFDVAATQGLSTILTLDANNQNNVFWVFQMADTFITGASAQVQIINAPDSGASDGIFWDVHNAITFGATNQLLGNYLAGTAITVGSTTSGVNGARIMAQTAVGLDTNIINSLGGPGGSDWTGGLMYSSPAHTSIVPSSVPEPAAFLWLAPLGAMGFVLWRRRSVANKIAA